MTPRELLDFLSAVEPLKSIPRHNTTRAGVPESVAAHSWRLALFALLLAPEFPTLDMARVLRMCVIHDIGEAVTGDIPSFLKTKAEENVEDHAVASLLSLLPAPQKDTLTALFSEMEGRETREARLYKALDRLEAVISHNESDISTWLPLEYDLQRTYAVSDAAEFPFLARLRAEMLSDTERKIGDAQKDAAAQDPA